MMPATLPLGIDVGRRRVRVALCERDASGRPTLVAVAARDRRSGVPAELGEMLREAVGELATRERRCVLGIAHPDASLRILALPPMTPFERRRTATLQASRYVDYPVREAAVSVHPLDQPNRWAIAIARRDALQMRAAAAKAARLRPLAIDDVAFALARAIGDADGTIDVSDTTTRLTIFGRPLPFVAETVLGGDDLTAGIARSLGVDSSTAEERKRSIGFAGAGEAERDRFVDGIVAMLAGARAAGHVAIGRLVTIGNGSRVPGLAEAVECATGCGVRAAALPASASDRIPADVLRAAGPDWSIAYGLSLWSEVA